MKFKKLDTKLFTTLHHYTPSENIQSILETGLDGRNSARSYFKPEIDKIKDVHLQDTLDKIQKRNDRHSRINDNKRAKHKQDLQKILESNRVKDRDELFNKLGDDKYTELMDSIRNVYKPDSLVGEFNNEKLPAHYRQLSMMDGYGGVTDRSGGSKVKNRTQVRVVADIPDNEIYDLKGYPYESRSKYNATPNRLKIQLPYGSVTKNTKDTYINNLKDVDPSKFDVNDTYTRRIYNLWAKKNGKSVLPGSDKYRSTK